METDPKPSKMGGGRQRLPSPSKCKVPAQGGRWPLATASSVPAPPCAAPAPPGADTPLYLYLKQVALSDTFIIVFNSRKSVFALEERTRT